MIPTNTKAMKEVADWFCSESDSLVYDTILPLELAHDLDCHVHLTRWLNQIKLQNAVKDAGDDDEKILRISKEMLALPEEFDLPDEYKSRKSLTLLNRHLLKRTYICWHSASEVDFEVHDMFDAPPPSGFINVCRWYKHIEAYKAQRQK